MLQVSNQRIDKLKTENSKNLNLINKFKETVVFLRKELDQSNIEKVEQAKVAKEESKKLDEVQFARSEEIKGLRDASRNKILTLESQKVTLQTELDEAKKNQAIKTEIINDLNIKTKKDYSSRN